MNVFGGGIQWEDGNCISHSNSSTSCFAQYFIMILDNFIKYYPSALIKASFCFSKINNKFAEYMQSPPTPYGSADVRGQLTPAIIHTLFPLGQSKITFNNIMIIVKRYFLSLCVELTRHQLRLFNRTTPCVRSTYVCC